MRAGFETDKFGDSQGVEKMVLIEVVDVLAGDDVDLGVPIGIQIKKSRILPLLLFREMWKVFEYFVHLCLSKSFNSCLLSSTRISPSSWGAISS